MRNLLTVNPNKDFTIELVYSPYQKRLFDVKPLLSKGKFCDLKNWKVFKQVRVSFDTVSWNNGMDICPDFLYETSIKID